MNRFDINEIIVRKLFYGYTHGELTGNHIENELVGVTANYTDEHFLIPTEDVINNGYYEKLLGIEGEIV